MMATARWVVGSGFALLAALFAGRAAAWNSNQGTRLHGNAKHKQARGDVVWFPMDGWKDRRGKAIGYVEVVQGKLLPHTQKGDGDPMDLLGATVQAKDTSGHPVTLRIEKILPPPNPPFADQPHPFDPGSTLYYTLVDLSGPTPVPYCAEAPRARTPAGALAHVDSDRGLQAVPVAEVWNEFGTQGQAKLYFTMACTSGVIAKCYRCGYQGWKGPDMKSTVQACTRMAMADYCGDGQSHTAPGTPIELYDLTAAQTNADEPKAAGMTFETAWVGGSPHHLAGWTDREFVGGALCLSKLRWDTIPLTGAALSNGGPPLPGSPACPRLANLDPRVVGPADLWTRAARYKATPADYTYTPGDFCDYLTDGKPDAVNVDALRKAGALLANRSTHLDALLAKWTSTSGKHRTSARLVDSGALPGAPKVVGYLRPSTPQGTVFKTSPPPEVLGSAAVVPLKTYRNAAGDLRTTTAATRPAGYTTEVELEGLIYPCVAGQQGPTKSTPLYTQKISSTDYVTHVLPTAPANTPCAGPDVPLVIEGYLPVLSD